MGVTNHPFRIHTEEMKRWFLMNDEERAIEMKKAQSEAELRKSGKWKGV
jgi:hypothetical protein